MILLFLRQQFAALKKKQSAVHNVSRQNSPRGFDLRSVPTTDAKRWNINRVKGTGIRWIVMAALSNTPSPQACHLVPATKGAIAAVNSSPLHIYPPNASLESIHFTWGIFVSPSLFSHCAECVAVCEDDACAYSASMHSCVWLKNKTVFTQMSTLTAMRASSVRGASQVPQQGSLRRAATANPVIINSHLLDLAAQSIPQCLL